MPAGESGSLSSLKAADCVYFVLACGAGIWEAWCAGWSGDDALAIFLLISMSEAFAVLSSGYMLQFGGGGHIGPRSPWKPIVILWAGMPLSVLLASLSMTGVTRALSAAGFRVDNNVPYAHILIGSGEAVACLAWTACLQVSSRRSFTRARSSFPRPNTRRAPGFYFCEPSL